MEQDAYRLLERRVRRSLERDGTISVSRVGLELPRIYTSDDITNVCERFVEKGVARRELSGEPDSNRVYSIV